MRLPRAAAIGQLLLLHLPVIAGIAIPPAFALPQSASAPGSDAPRANDKPNNPLGSMTPLYWGLTAAGVGTLGLPWLPRRVRNQPAGARAVPPTKQSLAFMDYMGERRRLWFAEFKRDDELWTIHGECMESQGYLNVPQDRWSEIFDECTFELLREHRDKVSPELLVELSALRAAELRDHPELEPLLEPDPNPTSLFGGSSAGAPPRAEKMSVASNVLANTRAVPKIAGEQLRRGWQGAMFGSGTVGSQGRGRSASTVPGVKMIGGRGPLKF